MQRGSANAPVTFKQKHKAVAKPARPPAHLLFTHGTDELINPEPRKHSPHLWDTIAGQAQTKARNEYQSMALPPASKTEGPIISTRNTQL